MVVSTMIYICSVESPRSEGDLLSFKRVERVTPLYNKKYMLESLKYDTFS